MEKKAKGKEITVINKVSWSKQEDQTLFNYVTSHGEGKWQKIAQKAGLRRCGKSCRQRWLNYLKPGIKRGDITPDEEDMIIRLHRLLGNRWALIAKRLPGRTDNEIKNYWNISLSKKLQRQRQPTSTSLSPSSLNPLPGLAACWVKEDGPIHEMPDQFVHSRAGQYWSKEDSQTSPSPFTKDQNFRKTKHVINVVTPQASQPTRRANEAIRTYSDNNTRGPGSSNQMHYGPLNNDANFPISDFLTNDDDDDEEFDDQNQFLMPENLRSHGKEDQNNVLPEKLSDPMDNVLDMELKRVAYFLGLEDECTLE